MTSSQANRKFVRQKENHALKEKQKLGALVEKLKKNPIKKRKLGMARNDMTTKEKNTLLSCFSKKVL